MSLSKVPYLHLFQSFQLIDEHNLENPLMGCLFYGYELSGENTA